jgi:hypothetical protein
MILCVGVIAGCDDNSDFDEEGLNTREDQVAETITTIPSILDFTEFYSDALQAEDNSDDSTPTLLPNVRAFDSTLESMLNANGEIIVGNKYFRFFNDRTIAVVPTYDTETKELVSGWGSAYFTGAKNIKLLGLEDSSKKLYDMDDSGRLVERDHADLRYSVEYTDSGYELTNRSFVSLVDSGPHDFKWIVNDEEESSSDQIHISHDSDLTTVSLGLFKDGIKIFETERDTLETRDACDYSVTTSNVGGCTYRFHIFWANPEDRYAIIHLPDGSKVSAPPAEAPAQGAIVEIDLSTQPCSEEGVLFYGVELPGYCDASWQYSMDCPDCGCGKKDDRQERESIGNIRVTKKLWISQNLFGLHIGSFTKTQRKRWGIWLSREVDQVYTSFEAAMRDKADGCSDLAVPFGGEAEDNSSYVARNIDLSGHAPRYFPDIDLVRSTHRVTIDGQVHNLSPLTLQ